MVLGATCPGLQLVLLGQGLDEGRARRVGDGLLEQAVRRRRSGGQSRRELEGHRQHLVGLHHGVQQAHLEGLLGGERLRQQEQRRRTAGTDQSRQRPRQAGVGGQPDPGEGRRVARAGRPDAQVERAGDAQAGPGGRAVDRRDRRDGQLGQHRHERVEVLAHRGKRCGVAGVEHRRVLAQVLPRAEGAPGTGQDQRPVGAVVAHGAHRRQQRQLHLDGERVHALGAVDRDQRYGAGLLETDGVGHGGPSRRRSPQSVRPDTGAGRRAGGFAMRAAMLDTVRSRRRAQACGHCVQDTR